MAIVGGTASEIGGGKFANGAWGSAFQYLFNDSIQIGLGVNAGSGAGASTSGGFIIAHDDNKPWYQGWSFGTYETVATGIMAGADGSVVIDISYSKNNNIFDLSGQAITVGGSVGSGRGYGFETNIPVNSNAVASQTLSVGLYAKPVPIPVEIHLYTSTTEVNQW
jgi:hypothetical protein